MSKLQNINKTELEQEIDIKYAIGDCILAWAEIESHLLAIFSCLIEKNQAYILWDSIVSFEAKLNCISSLMPLILTENYMLKIWAKLAVRISKKHKKRNEIAHSTLCEDDATVPLKVFLVPYFSLVKLQSKKGLTAKEITERTESFDAIADALNWFLYKAFPSYVYAPENHNTRKKQPPIPDLIIHYQNLISQNLEET